MKLVQIAVFASLAFIQSSFAGPSPIVIWHNPGGYVAEFAARAQDVEKQGHRVEVRGPCASSCTIILHNPRMCIAPGGSFKFHRAFHFNEDGTRGVNPDDELATQYLWSQYPMGVQNWITAHGGLTDNFLVLNSHKAWSLGIPKC